MTGIISKKTDRGFGFIKMDDPNARKDIFFHATGLKNIRFDELQEGETVTFDIEQGDKGPVAKNVTVP